MVTRKITYLQTLVHYLVLLVLQHRIELSIISDGSLLLGSGSALILKKHACLLSSLKVIQVLFLIRAPQGYVLQLRYGSPTRLMTQFHLLRVLSECRVCSAIIKLESDSSRCPDRESAEWDQHG